jgi:UDP-N-acetylmuramyl pentapeptide phosphotransferase/UDP-N-acetylglucosamine-1-phosphate transferase
MLILFIFSMVTAAVACAVLRQMGGSIARRYSLDMPQRFHAGHVPRLGGAAMMLGCTAGWGWAAASADLPVTAAQAWGWWLTMLIAAGAGLAEDITHRIAARWRLLLTLLASVTATVLLGLHIGPLDLAALKPLWAAAPWVGTVLAVIAVAGLPNAFNLIDGYNGLAGMVALICCLAIAGVALQVGDFELVALVLVAAGATLGFLAWNYPRGLIFAGDGGAYLWGAVIAVASIQLVQRHDQVSPWFPALLLIYPVWETLFSIYRKLVRGQSPGDPDALHFHQLIYRRIVRPIAHEDPARRMLARNNRTTPYLWGLALLAAVPAVVFWRDTPTLMAFSGLFIASYVVAYVGIVRFKVPRWLRS